MRRTLGLLLCLASLGSEASAEEWSFEVPGPLRSQALFDSGDAGAPPLFLLVQVAEELYSVWRVDSRDRAASQVVPPFESKAVPRLETFAGRLEPRLLVILGDEARFFDAMGSPWGVMPRLRFAPGSQVLAHPSRPWLAVADVGELTVHDLGTARGPARERIWTSALPVAVVPGRRALDLSSPELRPLRGTDTSRSGYSVGPELLQNRRLRSLLLFPWEGRALRVGSDEADDLEESGEGSSTIEEASLWSMLPGVERLVDSEYLVLDGARVLSVTTLRADKQGILERKKLRLFRLDSDRTRAGGRPFFEKLTASRLWQRLLVRAADFDGDGRSDLALVQPEGLGGDKLLVDVHRGDGEGQLAAKATRRVVKARESTMSLDLDLSGDGAPDLLVRQGGEALAFSFSGEGRRAVDEPVWRAAFPEPSRSAAVGDDETPRRRMAVAGGLVVLSSGFDSPEGEEGAWRPEPHRVRIAGPPWL